MSPTREELLFAAHARAIAMRDARDRLSDAAPDLLAALKGFEGAFDAWYANSGYMCECLDRLNEAENQGLSAEVARLHNLLALSLEARTAIAKAKGEAP